MEDTFFSPYPSKGFQISPCKFHKNSLSEWLLEVKAVTLWDELTEHKAGSQKASFQFLTEVISFFTVPLYKLPNITLKSHKISLSERLPYGKGVTRLGVLTEHTTFSQKASFQFLTEDIFFITIAPFHIPNITLQIPQEQS